MLKPTLSFVFLIICTFAAQADPTLTNRFVWLHAGNGVEREVIFGSTRETVVAWHDNRDDSIAYSGYSFLPKFQSNSIASRPSLQFGYDVSNSSGQNTAAPTYLQATRSPSLQSLSIFAVCRSKDSLYGPILSGISGNTTPWSFQFKGTNGLVWRQGTTISGTVLTLGSSWNIVEVQKQGSSVKLGSNGLLAPPQIFATVPPAGIATRIGGSATDYLNGNIAELLVYTKATGSAITPADRVNILKYLGGRYGISLTNTPPTVRITSPLTGSTVAKGKVPTLKVAASDDGSVVSVKYFVNGKTTPLAEVKTPPFSYEWKTVTVRSHTVKAIATDEFGRTKISATISFTKL